MGDRTAPPNLPLDPPVVVIVGPLQWRILGDPGPPLIVRPNRGPSRLDFRRLPGPIFNRA